MAEPDGPECFLGEWRLSRQIDDRHAGRIIAGTGLAWFRRDGDGGVIQQEQVTLQVPGHGPLTGTRRYLWRGTDAQVDVFFDDGRPFHRISLECVESRDLHHCAPDLYECRYDFADWPRWQTLWRVRGPRKDYAMTTIFSR